MAVPIRSAGWVGGLPGRARFGVATQAPGPQQEKLRPGTPAADAYRDWQRWATCLAALRALLADIPEAWRTAASSRMPDGGGVPPEAEVVTMLLCRLGWQVGDTRILLR